MQGDGLQVKDSVGLTRCRMTHKQNMVGHIRPGTEKDIPNKALCPGQTMKAPYRPVRKCSRRRVTQAGIKRFLS